MTITAFEFVWLWTDIMVWVLFVALILGVQSIRSSLQSRRQWHQVFQSPIAMVSAVVLSTYLLIALIDSVHFKLHFQASNQAIAEEAQANTDLFQLDGRVLSGLDYLFSHLLLRTERTYSAPFALTEYSSSVQYTEDGKVEQVYLPLKYAGQHLKGYSNQHLTAEERMVSDIAKQTSSAVMMAVLVIFLVFLVHLYLRFRYLLTSDKAGFLKRGKLPWRWFYFALFIIVFTLIWLHQLSHYYYVLGTDKVGQDVLYQSLKAIRTGVLIGLLTTLVMLPLALILGISAGYFKGWIDDVIQYLYTTLNSIPGVLLIAAAVLVMQQILAQNQDWFGSTEERADLRLLFLILILGITSWTGLCRLLRAETLKISQLEYVQSARAFGLGGFSIIKKHIAPNLMHLVLIALVLDFSGLVLAEAVLSYVGVGVDPTTPSWGNMINQARLEMAREPMVWWSLLSAFSFMFVLVLAANLFSDRVQWVLDPRGKK